MGVAAAASFFLAAISRYTFLDMDLWHEMATFREALALGRLPMSDSFAYTPTVQPVVHHEWGTGAVLYAVHELGGPAALLALKYVLCAAVALLGWRTARQRGGRIEVVAACAPLAAYLGQIGCTTVRAQVFTLLCLALLLAGLTQNDRGRRWWLAWWLPLFVVWLNLHAGFLVGLGLCGCYFIEQCGKRQPAWHLLVAGLAMIGLIAVNPYGLDYFGYLWRGVRMDRPDIGEWAPLWSGPLAVLLLPFYAVSVAVVVVAVRERGWRQLPGLLLVAVCAWMALKHVRHLSLYALVWWCFAPGYLQGTSLERAAAGLWSVRPRVTAAALAMMLVACLAVFVSRRGWEPRLPVVREAGPLVYPLGAVQHLRADRFRGNLMVPFEAGAYVLWHLTPDVKVSLDGRYEVAYAPGVFEAHEQFYRGKEGWREALARFPSTGVLVPTHCPIVEQMGVLDDWRETYRDPSYVVFSRTNPAATHPAQ
jgi:hypothetical protein